MCFSFEMCEGVYDPSFHGINGLFDYIPLRENVCMLHPQRGLKLANAGIIVQFRLSNPDDIVTLNMRDKPLRRGISVDYVCHSSSLSSKYTRGC